MINIKNDLKNIDWNFVENASLDEGYDFLSAKILQSLDTHAPEKQVTIPARYVIRDPWMMVKVTKGFG